MSRVKSRRSVLFVAGDLSGDHFSARLARLTAARHPDLVLHALGGGRLGEAVRATGGVWIGDTTNCSAIGLVSVLKIYLRARWLSFLMRRFVRSRPVDVVVLCDWGGFNCRQLKFFRAQGIPILYYFPPRSWQRSGRAGLQFAPYVDRVATPFRWSAERLAAVGCRAKWVGHPLLEDVGNPERRAQLRREFGVGPDEKLVALLPGSRRSEMRVLGPCLAETAVRLAKSGRVSFVVPVPGPLVELARKCFPPEVRIVVGRSTDALTACDAAIVKMGSATLEAAVLGVPQVAVYDLGWAARLEWVLLWTWKKIPFIAMPNIILQQQAVPEVLGLNCRPETLTEWTGRLLQDSEERARMQAAYAEIREHLGAGLSCGATEQTLGLLEEMLAGTGERP